VIASVVAESRESLPLMPARVPVISIGNIAFGGRGKTPTTALVARLLVEAGERPAILSRGYRRRDPVDGVVIVSDGIRQLADVGRGGDEPILLARSAPGAAVLVCDVRAMSAALAEAHLGCTVHVLDDGFQHRSLGRDVDLVIVTATDLVGRRAPFGRLRSSPRALGQAAAVIVDGDLPGDASARLSLLIDSTRTKRFALTRRLGAADWIEAPPEQAAEPLAPGSRVVAAAGIAEPRRFVDALVSAGWGVVEFVEFRDHHVFTRRDLARLRDVRDRTGAAAVVTTGKDAVRLLPLRPLGLPAAQIPLEVAIEPAAEFRAWLVSAVAEARR
jgi:tetraacyldisaccharide 4'-kinase